MLETISHSIVPAKAASADRVRRAVKQRYLMCRPRHFEVAYSINYWMDTSVAVDGCLAIEQWNQLRRTFEALGHEVVVMEDVPGLPDMVFAANAGVVKGNIAMVSRFRSDFRRREEEHFSAWFEAHGFQVLRPSVINEGEGDFLWTGSLMLGGCGFRSDRNAAAEITELLGFPVIALQLVDPRWYHIDTALAVLDEETIAYVPAAFSKGSLRALEHLCPNAIKVSIEDAEHFALNAVSDGKNVVVAEQASDFREQLASRGFTPVPVDVSEFLKAGGGAKCCTLVIRR